MTHANLAVRLGAESDLEQLNDIYNQYVKETHFTFDIEPMTMDARREWFSHYGPTGRYRLLVAASDHDVVGFACSSRFRPKPAYETPVAAELAALLGEMGDSLEAETLVQRNRDWVWQRNPRISAMDVLRLQRLEQLAV